MNSRYFLLITQSSHFLHSQKEVKTINSYIIAQTFNEDFRKHKLQLSCGLWCVIRIRTLLFYEKNELTRDIIAPIGALKNKYNSRSDAQTCNKLNRSTRSDDLEYVTFQQKRY